MPKSDIANGNGGEQCSPRHVRQEQPSKDKGRLRDLGGGKSGEYIEHIRQRRSESNGIDRGQEQMQMKVNHNIWCIDQGGGKSQCLIVENKSPTLTCTHQGEPVAIYEKAKETDKNDH